MDSIYWINLTKNGFRTAIKSTSSSPDLLQLMALKLETLPSFVVNLKRRPDRKANMTQLMSSLGVRNVRFLDAVDGSALLRNCSGRSRLHSVASQKYKLTWTDGDTGIRRSQLQRLPPYRDARRGWDMWGLLGCSLSHVEVWRLMEQDSGP